MLIELWNARKIYGREGNTVIALDDVTTSFAEATFTAIMGPSGSGKSTLLQCAAGLDDLSDGKIIIGGTQLSALSERERTLLRRDRLGFVFQSFNLVASLTAAQNTELPLRLAGKRPSPQAVRQALAQVGLAERAHHRPSELSGGQQQRVAIARALITRPQVLFADEPTGALDTATSRDVLRLLRALVDDHGQTIVMVTHDPVVAAQADRLVFLKDGRIYDETGAASPEQIAARMTRLEA
ncbi:ABC transporter ATP-binding protein [Catelliglobosispora koreensis]|uniref:ABC transporter ATP-binding protein n=1 Tax=Catelliglobosispora koreensis TaxID=129052 RepID=UPI00036C41A5